MLKKTIGITTKNYKISMTSPLKFYEDDNLELFFKITEIDVQMIGENGESIEIEKDVFPESAILFVENYDDVDTIESTSINGNEVCFQLTSKYTGRSQIGTGRMQIVLFDGTSRKALPPFEYEVQPVIYQPILYNGLYNEEGISLLAEDGMLLDSTDRTYGIKISALPYTDIILGTIPIVQYGVTKQIDIQTIVGNITEVQVPNIVDSKIQQSIDETITPLIDGKIDTVLGGSDLDDLIDTKIADSTEYSNPVSDTIIDFKSALDYILYYDLVINLTCNRTTVLEVGAKLHSITFDWTYNKNIVSQSFNNEGLPIDQRRYIFNETINSNREFKLFATDERKTFTKTISFSFRPGRYWGTSSSTNLDNDGILSLNKELSTGRGKTFTVNANEGEYIYYCYPMSWGAGNFSVGGFTGGFDLVGNINFTNSLGYTSMYYVYRSTNHSLGDTVVTVS